MQATEEYVVKFWITNSEGYQEQQKESVFLYSKGKHKEAESIIIKKYRKKPYNTNIKIISVTYQ